MYTSYYTENKVNICPDINSKLSSIKYIIIDVDGTLTDGGIYYDENGNELKKFNTKDAAGFFVAKTCGIYTMVITGRKCMATERRMNELQVGMLEQGVVNKIEFIKKYMQEHNINKNELAYIGDDLNDYSGMLLAGFRACPQDAVKEIKEICNYVSPVPGGQGAFRDVMEYILKERGQLSDAYKICYHID